MTTERQRIVAALRERVPVFAARVAPLYQLLGWRWRDRGVPTEDEIRETLFELVKNLSDGSEASRSGGLHVYMPDEDDDEPLASLCFVVEEHIYEVE